MRLIFPVDVISRLFQQQQCLWQRGKEHAATTEAGWVPSGEGRREVHQLYGQLSKATWGFGSYQITVWFQWQDHSLRNVLLGCLYDDIESVRVVFFLHKSVTLEPASHPLPNLQFHYLKVFKGRRFRNHTQSCNQFQNNKTCYFCAVYKILKENVTSVLSCIWKIGLLGSECSSLNAIKLKKTLVIFFLTFSTYLLWIRF